METTVNLADQISGVGIYASAANWAKSADDASMLGGNLPDYYYAAEDAATEFANVAFDVNYLSGAIDNIPAQVQSDWEETDITDPAYIQNKPDKLDISGGNGIEITEDQDKLVIAVSADYATETYVDTAAATKVDKVSGYGLSKNDFTDILYEKLTNIEDGAEVNVQADWEETDSTEDSYIQNKPANISLVAGSGINITEVNNTLEFSVAPEYVTDTELAAAIANFGGFSVTAVNQQGVPDVPSPDTKTIYLTKDTSVIGSDKYKEWIWSTSATWELIGDTSIDLNGYAQMPSSYTQDNIAVYGQGDILVDSQKSIADLTNVQSDWNETDNTKDAYIANKPDVLIPQIGAGVSAMPKYVMVVTAMPAAAAIDPNTIYLVQGTYTGTT